MTAPISLPAIDIPGVAAHKMYAILRTFNCKAATLKNSVNKRPKIECYTTIEGYAVIHLLEDIATRTKLGFERAAHKLAKRRDLFYQFDAAKRLGASNEMLDEILNPLIAGPSI